MQELMVPAQSTSPYTPVGGANMSNTPQLGTPVPGTTGGLPALSGLSVTQNPMAEQLQSMGRGEDSMLVHMTPNEVNSLRGLAQRFGGDLSVNPNTGLPEAGWLGKLLPTILGIAGAAFGIPTWAIGLGVGAGQTAITGDLGAGLTAGLQAFGGAGLGQAAGIGGKLGSVGADLGLTKSLTGGVSAATGAGGAPALGKAAQGTLEAGFDKALGIKAPGFLSRFGAETALGQTGLLGKALPAVAGSSVLGGISEATAPKMPKYKGDKEESSWNYEGPYVPGERQVSFQTPERMRETGGAEATYFTPSNPVPGYRPASSLSDEEQEVYGFADGGLAALPTPPGFKEAVSMFGAANPGAITASMYPTTPATPATPAAGAATPAPTAAREQSYSFQNRPSQSTAPTSPTMMDYGYVDIPGVGNIQIPNFSGYNWNNIDWDAIASQAGYIPQSEAVQVNVPEVDLSGIQSRLDALQQAQPTQPTQPTQPAFDPSTFDWSSVLSQYTPDLSGIQSQLSALQQPTQPTQPTQPAFDPSTFDWSSVMSQYTPDLSGIQSRLDALQQAQQAAQPTQPAFDPSTYDWASILPNYGAPDLSGIQSRLDALQQAQQAQPTQPAFDPSTYDWSSILPKYEAPDLSGIQSQLSALQKAQQVKQPTFDPSTYDWSSIMSQYTPDLSGIQSQLSALQQAQQAPTPTSVAPAPVSPYNVMTPGIYDYPTTTRGMYASGGTVNMRDGSFVVDARTVSELGNGSSNAGMEMLSRMGGRPVRGPGDGVSDSVKASIGGKQEARVARDEVIFPPEAVRRLGGGSDKRGTQKLYAMMNKAHAARKKAKRGQDTGLRRGLA